MKPLKDMGPIEREFYVSMRVVFKWVLIAIVVFFTYQCTMV